VWQTLEDHPEALYGAALALVIVILLTPAVGGMARLLGVVDEPGARRMNRKAVPRLGGLALFFGIFVPALAFLPFGRETKGLLLGAAVATLVGAIDDFRGLGWWEKLGGQIAAAAIPTGFGIWVHRFTFPIVGVHALPEWVGVPLTVLWIVAIMNMVNFLDGLDGLAAGVCAISGFTFCLIALSLGRAEPAILAAVVFGACLGFLRHNFYPARIFMGDSGALLLGFTLGALAIQGLLKTAAVATLLFPLLVLAVPIIDTSFVVAKRLKYRQPVYAADRYHLHHRFMNIGFSQPRAALYMWSWCAVLAGAALATRFILFRAHGVWHLWQTVAVAAIGAVALAASIYMVYLLEIVKLANPRIRRREQEAREAAARRTA
jgi:UDP-GlcNAc:undecaprenyl-phosphate/decaprenyl-phosphate GlcNAc-1-phosphate transferase